MAVTHHKVTSLEQLYDLWEAGLLYSQKQLCTFPGHAIVGNREDLLQVWRCCRRPPRPDRFTYALEE